MTSTLESRAERTSTPERMCVVCRRGRPKPELFRIARTPRGVRVDQAQRLPGRGAYVCRAAACIDQLVRRRGAPLARALPGTTDDEMRTVTEDLRAAVAAAGSGPRSMPSETHQRSTA